MPKLGTDWLNPNRSGRHILPHPETSVPGGASSTDATHVPRGARPRQDSW